MPLESKTKSNIKIIVFLLVVLVVDSFAYQFFNREKPEDLYTNVPVFVSETVGDKPLIEEPPKTDLLGQAELSYAGGTEGRNKNIELGVARLNGLIVLPGEEFSFTKAIGLITAEDGFSEEKVFQNNEVTKGLGGGLCQVSTILFQSVISAGLPITERQNHSYSVSFYDVGLDATYADPGPDLKFINDTAYPVTIKGKTENQKVIFEIYGVSDGRQASTTEAEISQIVDFPTTKYIFVPFRYDDEPECVNNPQIGYTAKVVYNILYATGQKKEQVFTSTYKPLQKVCFIVGNWIKK